MSECGFAHSVRATIGGIVLLALLSACTLKQSSGLSKPAYVRYDDVRGYVVYCPGLNVKSGSLDFFYNIDGTLKTRDQICRESNPGTKIR